MESKRMPLRSRLAALHGDADEAAEQLNHMARSFRMELDRLMVEETPATTRRGLRLGLSRPALQPAPGIVGAPATSA